MSAEQLGAIAGVLLSLAFSYVPGLRDKFAGLDATQKRLVMAGLLVLVSAGALALSCAQLVQAVSCSEDGLLSMITTFIAALVSNQAAFLISPQKSTASGS